MPAHVRVHDYPNAERVMLTRHLNFLIARKLGIGINRVERTTWAFWETVAELLADGHIVYIDGLGSFRGTWGPSGAGVVFVADPDMERRVRLGR